jgi:hypothetical protein
MCWCAMPDPTPLAKVLSENYMAERTPINGVVGAKYFFVGRMVDADLNPIMGMELVIDSIGRGQHWYHCREDNTIFPCNGACHKCGRSVRAEKPSGDLAPDASVTAHNATG